ncbi:MAG: PIN domain protein [Euryarchaeota archaeon ADurb.Bin294]|nr:MAG: PIN domain protein [Euryarchaeota archaeon ADurb.Bin294]
MNNLSKIPNGTKLIIDTNILVYFALAHKYYGPSCKLFLSKIQQNKLHGFIPSIVLNELTHSLMMAELIQKGYGKTRSEVIQYLKNGLSHSSEGKLDQQPILSTTWDWIERISDLNCTIIYETETTITDSFYFSKKYGLLAKDAYIAAFGKTHNIFNIASNDSDFNVLPGFTIWKPDL